MVLQGGVQCAEGEGAVEVVVAELQEDEVDSGATEGVGDSRAEVGEAASALAAAEVVVVVMQTSLGPREDIEDEVHSINAGRCGAWIPCGTVHTGLDQDVDLHVSQDPNLITSHSLQSILSK